MLIKTLADAVVVPDDAIQHGVNGLYSFVVDQDNKANLQKVKVGQSVDGRSVVESGLTPGQQVIVTGQYRVQPGSLVSTAVANSEQTPAKAQ